VTHARKTNAGTGRADKRHGKAASTQAGEFIKEAIARVSSEAASPSALARHEAVICYTIQRRKTRI